MSANLPRVTYSNIGADFGPLHDWLDEALPRFRKNRLGQNWPNIINGAPDSEGTPYMTYSPIDRELLVAHSIAANASAVERAVSAARNAQDTWSGIGWQKRVEILRRWANEIDVRKYDMGMAALFEVGKSRIEAIGEAEEAVDMVNYYCDEMEKNNGYERQQERAVPHEETICRLRPIGVFAVIAPFNFSIALPCNMIGAALVAGNTVVFKPSEGNTMTSTLLVEAALAANIPAGVINMVCGEAAGPLLVNADGVDGFAFTGSHEVGMSIYRKVQGGPFARPVICEMGGKNPTYITATADLDVAADGLVRSAFGLQGEKCSACSVAYVEKCVYEPLLEALRNKTAALKVGTPEDADTFVGPIIDEAALARFDKAVNAARSEGRIIHGGNRLTDGDLARGNFVEPTIVADLPAGHWLNYEEQFMPFLSVQPCDNLSDGITRGNKIVYGLSAGIYATNEDELNQFYNTAQSGVLYANRRSGATTGAWPGFQTFCGWKGSGVDNKGGLGPYTVPRYMREQSLTIMHSE